jgi:hypothetical protein
MTRRVAFAAIFGLTLVVFAPALIKREVFTFRDHTDYFQPLRWFTAFELRAGRLPIWNSYSASGEPWLANPQTGVFYPPQWLFVVLPFETAYVLFLALHVALLGAGAWLLFSLRVSPRAALAGAVALMFCGPVMSLLDIGNNLTTFAWLPLVIWCAMSRASARLSAFAIAMSFLAGEPFFAGIGALAFAAIRLRPHAASGTPLPPGEGTGVRAVVDVALTSFALAAVQLFPFLEMLRVSDRAGGGVPREQILRDSMPPLDWVRVALPPHLVGGVFDPFLQQHFIPIVYMGVITCVLALIGLRRDAWPALAVIAACVVVAGAGVIPPVGELFARLPVTLFRYPARVVPLAAIAIAFLAARGIERLLTPAESRRHADSRDVAPAFSREVTTPDVAPAFSREVTTPDVAPALSREVTTPDVAPALSREVTAPDVARALSRRDATSLLLTVAIAIDLLLHVWPLLATAPLDRTLPYPRGFGRDAKIVRIGMEHARHVERRDWIAGYLNLYDRKFDVWTAAPLSSQRYTEAYESAMTTKPQLLNEFGAGYVLTAGTNGSVVARRNAAAYPLAYWRGVDGAMRAPQWMAFSSSTAVVAIDAPSDGVVTLTQQDAPWWRVSVDGARAEPLRGGLFRAVRVARGHHEIVWRARPLSLFLGVFFTLAAIVRMLFSTDFVKHRS